VNRPLRRRLLPLGLPAWRSAMTDTLTIYPIGPSSVNTALGASWPGVPGGTVPDRFLIRGVGNDNQLHYGWNGSVFVPDIGTHGKLVYFGAGENYWGNDSTAFDLGESPTWEWWQGPHFCLSESQAESEDADAYWDPTAAAALAANRQFAETEEWYELWDQGFPVAHGGWIYRRKFTSNSHGNNRHWCGRYNSMGVIPAAMTGTGNSAIFINSHSWRGPFVSPSPGGYRPFSDWFAAVGVIGEALPRGYVFWQDTVTKVWSKISTPIPDGTTFGTWDNPACVDEVNERVYFLRRSSDPPATYYVDLGSGLAGATMSALTNLSIEGASPTSLIEDHTSSVYTAAHPTGRRLWYFRAERINSSHNNRLIMVDLDADEYWTLPIPGLDMDRDGYELPHCGLAYIPDQGTYGTLVLTTKTADRGPLAHFIPLPADPTVAANYEATTVELDLASGLTLETAGTPLSPNIFLYGQGKGGYMADLGVIMMPQRDGPMLAYRPF
jgi:hypothetical protein